MTPSQSAAFLNAQTAIFNCRLQGMLAENKQREITGDSPAYTEEAFSQLEKDFPDLSYNGSVSILQQALEHYPDKP